MRPVAIVCLIIILSTLGCSSSGDRKSKNVQLTRDGPAEVYVKLGKRYMSRGKNDVALNYLERAIQTDDKNSEAHNAIAVLYGRLKKDDVSLHHFKRAIKLDPNNAGARNNYGRFLCDQGKYPEAQEQFETAYNNPLYNRSWFALTNAGACSLKSGDKIEAERFFRLALEKNSRFAPALKEMIKLNFERKKYFQVRAFLQRYLNVAQHTPDTLWLGIQAENELGNQNAVSSYALLLRNKYPGSKETEMMRASFPQFR